MASRLWYMHLSRHVSGMVRGPVQSADARFVTPRTTDVRACLPAQYRKAFDRVISGGGRKVNERPDSSLSLTLRDTRGRMFNTLYAIPPKMES